MARITGVPAEEAGLRVRFIYWLLKRRLGRLSSGARIRAHDPRLLELAMRMDSSVASPGAVSLKLKELAQIKVAMVVGCPF
jgi:hypothetical protein